jgi:hypothetical protein
VEAQAVGEALRPMMPSLIGMVMGEIDVKEDYG